MNKNILIGALLTIIIASSLIVGYSQNWFQTSSQNTTPDPTATPQPTGTATQQPQSTPSPTATTPQPTPAPTTQPTTVASMKLVLEIYGNANMDDKIDANDLVYIQQIIDGQRAPTQFADANRDGVIDQKDIDHVRAIIDGQASKIYMLDGNKMDISVSLPKSRIIVEYNQNTELMRILNLEHLVVGVDSGVNPVKNLFFPENAASITNVGGMSRPDYEAILNLNPDILLTFSPGSATSDTPTEKASKLPGVDVVYLGLYTPNVTSPEDSRFIQAILKAGYIFNRVPRATEYANWILSLTSSINSRINTIPENQRRTVLLTNSPTLGSTRAYTALDTLGQACILAGGKNIAHALAGISVNVDTEWIVQQNPDYIFLHTVRYTYGGGTNEPAQGIDVNDPTGMKNVLQQYISQPAFGNLDAVTNNRVHLIAGDFRNNAMGGTLGAVYMAKILYPDVFTDLNPQTVHQEYITRFLRLNYNLDTNGVFLYPPITVNGDTVGIPNAAV